MQNRTQSTNTWFNQVYPTGWSVGQANLDGPWPRQNVLERKRSFYPRLYIPGQGNYDRPTWYGESFLLYIRPSSIINSPRFHAYCYLPSFCLSHASPGSHFFPSLLFSSIVNFPHTRSVDHNCHRTPSICIMPLPHTFFYSAFPRMFNAN
jgi:hypothetical protein